MRSSGWNLKGDKFKLGLWSKFLTVMAIKRWKNLHMDVMDCPSPEWMPFKKIIA